MRRVRLVACLVFFIPILSAGFFVDFNGHVGVPRAELLVAYGLLYLFFGTLIVWLTRRARTEVIVSVGSLGLALVAAEFAFRLWLFRTDKREWQSAYASVFGAQDLGQRALYVPHHYTVYALNPGLSLPNGTQHDSLGLRDRREFAAKVPGEIRVVLLGGSTTYATLVRDNDDTPAARMESLLAQKFPGIKVINAGLGGAIAAENLLRLELLIADLSPDVVLIKQGYNDAHTRITGTLYSDFRDYRRSWRELSAAERGSAVSIALWQGLLDGSALFQLYLRAFDAQEDQSIGRFVSVPGAARHEDQPSTSRLFERYTRLAVVVAKSLGARVGLVSEVITSRLTPLYQRTLMPEHNRILRRIANEEHAAFFDLDAAMHGREELFPDGVHVNEAGARVEGDLLADFVASEFLR